MTRLYIVSDISDVYTYFPSIFSSFSRYSIIEITRIIAIYSNDAFFSQIGSINIIFRLKSLRNSLSFIQYFFREVNRCIIRSNNFRNIGSHFSSLDQHLIDSNIDFSRLSFQNCCTAIITDSNILSTILNNFNLDLCCFKIRYNQCRLTFSLQAIITFNFFYRLKSCDKCTISRTEFIYIYININIIA